MHSHSKAKPDVYTRDTNANRSYVIVCSYVLCVRMHLVAKSHLSPHVALSCWPFYSFVHSLTHTRKGEWNQKWSRIWNENIRLYYNKCIDVKFYHTCWKARKVAHLCIIKTDICIGFVWLVECSTIRGM